MSRAALRPATRDGRSPGTVLGRGREGRRRDRLQRKCRPEALLEGALQDQRSGRHVLERDSQVHAEEALAVAAAAVLEAGDDLAEIGVDLGDALEEDAAGPRVQELGRVVGDETI